MTATFNTRVGQMTINEVLSLLNYKTVQDASFHTTGRKQIIDDRGVIQFVGNAEEVWNWLKQTKQAVGGD